MRIKEILAKQSNQYSRDTQRRALHGGLRLSSRAATPKLDERDIVDIQSDNRLDKDSLDWLIAYIKLIPDDLVIDKVRGAFRQKMAFDDIALERILFDTF